ncbi:Crp/Fnr family transcriptional regulator [Alkalibacillus almallahensis]|uniref:Crp/Fnr family transcriptional regulator n=1 Tax=Alkalibacillus almallahensis TaxID=1379154 RepID=UPI001420FB9B|nr:Crp/Fnr family transcriptional regulator [Alkalibacillus almallahensis]NIK12049.1 CRP/FNR family transcriptional regulator [Alkalibacillus almallahensis]
MTYSMGFFRQFPIFQDLADEELQEVNDIANQRDMKKGNVVFHQGEARDAVFFVISGLIKIYKVSESGQEQVINFIHSNDMFPHVGFFDDSPYPATAVTLTDTHLLAIPIEAFENLLIQKPKISIKVMRVMGKKILDLQSRVQQISTKTVFERTVSMLIQLTDELGENETSGEITLNLPITNTDLANMVGVTRESVNRTFNQLKKSNIITYDRNYVIVHDYEALLERI